MIYPVRFPVRHWSHSETAQAAVASCRCPTWQQDRLECPVGASIRCGAWGHGLVLGVAGLGYWMVGLNDLSKGLSQPKWVYERTSVNRTALLIRTGPSVILCLVLNKNFLFRMFIWQLSAFLWFQFWKSHCPTCFQVQSVQKYLRACVIPPGKVAPCMCVLPDLLPHSFILPSSLQFKKQQQQKKPKKPTCPEKLWLLCPWTSLHQPDLCWCRPSSVFSKFTHQNIRDSSQEEMGGVVETCFFFFLSFPSQQTQTLPPQSYNREKCEISLFNLTFLKCRSSENIDRCTPTAWELSRGLPRQFSLGVRTQSFLQTLFLALNFQQRFRFVSVSFALCVVALYSWVRKLVKGEAGLARGGCFWRNWAPEVPSCKRL